jgi:hypothetical protein
MTDDRRQPTRRVARTNRPAYVAYGGATVAFAGVLAALSWQVAAGADPAIGEGEQAAAAPAAQRVLVRRVVRRVIVTRDAPRDRGSAAPAAAAGGSAPAPAPAPASGPAPAPAPAPAPPTTRAS